MAFVSKGACRVAALDKYRQRVQKWARSGAGPMFPVEVVLSTGQGSRRGDCALVVESHRGRRIEVGRGFDAETLERLVTLLDKV